MKYSISVIDSIVDSSKVDSIVQYIIVQYSDSMRSFRVHKLELPAYAIDISRAILSDRDRKKSLNGKSGKEIFRTRK